MLILASACQQTARTELVLGIATDLAAPGVIDSVELQVASTSNGVAQVDKTWDITGTGDLPENLPGSFGIEADDPSTKLDVVLKGFKDAQEIVRRRALLGLVEGRTVFYRLTLTAACIDRTDCAASTGSTCVEGACRPLRVDPLALPDYDADSVTHVSCKSFTRFIDTSTGAPMPPTDDAELCPSDRCVEGTCLDTPNIQAVGRS
jgi:hypothetical protein